MAKIANLMAAILIAMKVICAALAGSPVRKHKRSGVAATDDKAASPVRKQQLHGSVASAVDRVSDESRVATHVSSIAVRNTKKTNRMYIDADGILQNSADNRVENSEVVSADNKTSSPVRKHKFRASDGADGADSIPEALAASTLEAHRTVHAKAVVMQADKKTTQMQQSPSQPHQGGPMQRSEDAVMGMCTYESPQVTCGVFVKSLRKSGYKGSIVLGVSPGANNYNLWLEKYKITAKLVKTTACMNAGIRQHTSCSSEDPSVPAALARFAAYLKWLKEDGYDGYVLVADTRDVFFQINPFAGLHMDKTKAIIEVAVEHGWDAPEDIGTALWGSRIKTSMFNRGWIANCMGNSEMMKIGDEKVLCSGSTIGTRSGMEAYFRAMQKEITDDKYKGHQPCVDYGVDQGFHNFILHNAGTKLPQVEVRSPAYGNGTMLTIGSVCSPPPSKKITFMQETGRDHSWEKDLKRDLDGYVLNDDGNRAPMVHQFDRCHQQFVVSGWLQHAFEFA